MDEPVVINILGQNLSVKSPDGEAAVKRTASYLENRIEEVQLTTCTADTVKLLLFTALNLADENIKVREELNNLEVEVESISSKILDLVE